MSEPLPWNPNDIPDPPCVDCAHWARCKFHRLACDAFIGYVHDWKEYGIVNNKPRCIVPSRINFRRLFSVRCQYVGCDAKSDPEYGRAYEWGTHRRNGQLVDLCPKHKAAKARAAA